MRDLPGFDNQLKAARHAIETAEKDLADGKYGWAVYGGPAHPCPPGFSEHMKEKYGVDFFAVTGCEIVNFEDTWATVYNACMERAVATVVGATPPHYSELPRWYKSKTGSYGPYNWLDREWRERTA